MWLDYLDTLTGSPRLTAALVFGFVFLVGCGILGVVCWRCYVAQQRIMKRLNNIAERMK